MTKEIKQSIIDNLKNVYDPEISINVYDLGLIYEINIVSSNVVIVMTLTSAFCPMADQIKQDVHDAVCSVNGIDTCDINITFEPPFGPDMMSEDAKLILGV
jgi:metal-sulfur cluster biosynthetic enzyme